MVAVQPQPSWALSAWPRQDPDDAAGRKMSTLNVMSDDQVHDQVGPPAWVDRAPQENISRAKMSVLEQQNRRMMEQLQQRNAGEPPKSQAQHAEDVREAFELLHTKQEKKDGEEEPVAYLNAFDLPNAFDIAGLRGVDEGQARLLGQSVGAQPGGKVTFQQFAAMCNMVAAGQVPASPPRHRDPKLQEAIDALAEEDVSKKKKGGADGVKTKAGANNYHAWLAKKVQLPEQVYQDFPDKLGPAPAAASPPRKIDMTPARGRTWKPARGGGGGGDDD